MLGALLALFWTPALADASCGLQLCQRPMPSGAAHSSWNASIEPQYAGFDLSGTSGHYLRNHFRAEFHPLPQWIVGGTFALVHLDTGTATQTGVGNAVLYAERKLLELSFGSLSAGTQLEIPLGGDEKGIASDHLELLPFVSLKRSLSDANLLFNAGMRLASGDDHGTGGSPVLFVDPHGDKEYLIRFGAESAGDRKTWHLKGFLDWQHSLDGPDAGTSYVFLGGSVRRIVAGRWSLGPSFEIPLTSPKRFDYRLGLTLATSL